MKQDAQLTAVEWLVDKILTEADKYNEDGDVIGIELWNAYKGCVDLSKFVEQAKEMEKERTSKLCYGVWRAFKTGANYIYISKDSSILGFVEPLSEEDRLKIDVELFIAI